MSKGLEVLKRLKDKDNHDEYLFREDTDKEKASSFLKQNEDDYSVIEKKLKALEIIKEKKPNIRIISYGDRTLEGYNDFHIESDMKPLTQDEYDLLKEVLR